MKSRTADRFGRLVNMCCNSSNFIRERKAKIPNTKIRVCECIRKTYNDTRREDIKQLFEPPVDKRTSSLDKPGISSYKTSEKIQLGGQPLRNGARGTKTASQMEGVAERISSMENTFSGH
ncbi:hypothetical protein TNCV_4336231 [Trichonephila clavipes]|nr:hypothetical protein TNCV_4336231 [Trichonephila clavipes]